MSIVSLNFLASIQTTSYSRDWTDAYACIVMKDKMDFCFYINRLIKPEVDRGRASQSLYYLLYYLDSKHAVNRAFTPRRAEILC